jgi:hypothetical protein
MGYPTIPCNFHFIWVGGNMPARNRQCVKSFAERCRGWKANLWIDRNNLLAGTRRGAVLAGFKNEQGKLTGEWDPTLIRGGDEATIQAEIGGTAHRLQDMRLNALWSLEEFATANGIILRDASEVSTPEVSYLFGHYQREMTDRGTNFGAASDILRILILLREGGIYLDTDVVCNEPMPYIQCPIDGARWSMVAEPGMETCSKADWHGMNWWIEKFGAAERPKVCNSTIACHPRSEALEAYREIVRTNYENRFSDVAQLKRYYNMANIRGQTIRITGPTAAKHAAKLAEIADQVYQQGSTEGLTDSQERMRKFHRRNWAAARQRENQAKMWGELWFNMKDAMFFPIYLITDQFFHDWL